MKKARRLENPFPRFPQSLNWGWQLLFLLESFGLASLFIHQEPSLNKFFSLPLWLKPLLVILLTLFVYGGAKFTVFHPRFFHLHLKMANQEAQKYCSASHLLF